MTLQLSMLKKRIDRPVLRNDAAGGCSKMDFRGSLVLHANKHIVDVFIFFPLEFIRSKNSLRHYLAC